MLFEPITPASSTFKADVPSVYRALIEGNQLTKRWEALPKHASLSFVIAAPAFGHALDFLLSWMVFDNIAPPGARLHFIAVEENPWARTDLEHTLSFYPELAAYAQKLIASYPVLTPGSHVCLFDEGRVTLQLMLGDVLLLLDELLICGDPRHEPHLRSWGVDAWFLDFSCLAQGPGMKASSMFITMAKLSSKEGTVSVASGESWIKEGLEVAGFSMQRQGKELQGVLDHLPLIRSKRYTPWFVDYPRPCDKRALILGAGLAGSCLAHHLAHKGWEVSLLETHEKPGAGASGNQQAVLFPNVSAYRSPLTAFMLNAFLYAARTYRELLLSYPNLGDLSGLLQLMNDKTIESYHDSLLPWLKSYPELGRFVHQEEASSLAGVDVHAKGLFVPQAGWLDSPLLCEIFSKTPGVSLYTSCDIQKIHYEHHGWSVAGHQAPVLIIAAGHRTKDFEQTAHLPLTCVRGQMTTLAAKDQGQLNVPLCAKGHMLPKKNGGYSVGATYQPGCLDAACNRNDDKENLNQASSFLMEPLVTPTVLDHWAGIRAVSLDHLPWVGPVADPALFNRAPHQARFHTERGMYHPGLYVCSGFGSRGLTTIPLAAMYLASLINHEPHGLTRTMAQSIAPARFLRKKKFKL
ncbi:MAG: FAD-dependent 5-carboxymethylaminomethyl-2-thiouridine(34) oxidoreductase MnmC [Legionellaceae bacterium]